MSDYEEEINRHYGRLNLGDRILEALQRAGKDVKALTRDDLAGFDELHSGGREATLALARLAGLRPGMRVLDVGSGVGGPARTLAAEFGCPVVGLDLTEEFCRVAARLTERVGLSDRVSFRQGNALEMPFDDGSFDVVWTQNTLMNIEDKRRLFREMHRVLRPEGLLGLQAVLAGPVPGAHYPVPWASGPDLSFLSLPADIRRWLSDSGFAELAWADGAARGVEGNRRPRPAPVPGKSSQVGISTLAGAGFAQMAPNMARNYEEGRVVTVQAVFRRSD